jgi:hypothetical protein
MVYDQKIKEEAFALHLEGTSFKKIATLLNEQYELKIAVSTIKRWSDKENWNVQKEETKEEVRKITQSNATKNLTRHINTLRIIQSEFLKKAQATGVDVRPNEMINTIRMLIDLEGATDVKEVVITEVAKKLPEAMKKAGLNQKQINKVIKIWIEETNV